jgi:tetratricopeptide (TPR) repeat protein
VSDLSLGAWRGHQVAREFSAQLGVDLPILQHSATVENRGEPNREISYADIVGDFIDAEARGDRATIESLELANWVRGQLSGHMAMTFMVLAPRFGIPWERTDTLFIRHFAQALKGTRSTLVLIAADESDPQTPVDWRIDWRGGVQPQSAVTAQDIAGLVPGIIAPELEEILRPANSPHRPRFVPLAHGHFLVPPERRRNPRDVPLLEFDRLGMLARSYGWLDAYAQFHGNKMYVEPWFLYDEARRRFAEGGTGITLRLMERATKHIRMGLEWGILQSYVQGLRIASHRFADASNIPEPPRALPADMRSFLLQSKGWGFVMTNALSQAEECFRQARAMTDPNGRDRREYLYLLNISALCRLKSNDIESALALEREIEERRERSLCPDGRLEYVNSINLARLHRRRGELQIAEHYFRKAFATTLGVRSDSDAVYTNVIMARLYAQSGRWREAFTCWVRAGLHWAATEVPEALGRRVVSSILGENMTTGAVIPEAVAFSLSASILSAAAASGITKVAHGLEVSEVGGRFPPTFVHTERVRRTLPDAAINRALLSSGFSVLALEDQMTASISGESSARLRALLYKLLEALAPPGFLAGVATIVVEDCLGREVPSTPEELLAVCIRLNVQDVALEGAVITLNRDIRSKMEQSLHVRSGCAVENVSIQGEHAVVCFKRYVRPTMLTTEESGLLAFIEEHPEVGDIVRRYAEVHSGQYVLQMLRGLEQKRVINMDLPAQAVTALVGTRPGEATKVPS